jgi:hypothetical protein
MPRIVARANRHRQRAHHVPHGPRPARSSPASLSRAPRGRVPRVLLPRRSDARFSAAFRAARHDVTLRNSRGRCPRGPPARCAARAGRPHPARPATTTRPRALRGRVRREPPPRRSLKCSRPLPARPALPTRRALHAAAAHALLSHLAPPKAPASTPTVTLLATPRTHATGTPRSAPPESAAGPATASCRAS